MYAYQQGCSYGGRRRAGPPSTRDFRPSQSMNHKNDFRPAQFFYLFKHFLIVPGTMFHNRNAIIS